MTKADYIRDRLSYIKSKVEDDSKQYLYDINKSAEYIFMNILNATYGYALKNGNDIKPNFPTIDLLDTANKIAIQVTSDTSKKKVKTDTVEAFKELVKQDEFKEYSDYKIKMFYIKNKPSNATLKNWEDDELIFQSDILGIEDINTEVSANPTIATKVYKTLYEILSDNQDKKIVFKTTLIQNYQTNFKIISLLLNDKKSIFINLAIIKEQKEKNKKEKEEAYKREAILNSYEEIHKPKEPIEIEELLNISNKSLIYGKAGIGKTTLCKYIAYKWAKHELYETFDYVVYIALREWKKDGLKGAILDNYYSRDIKEINFDIEENNSKTLFLFDGYDELDADKKVTLQKEINPYNLQNYIITTRPYGYQKSDFNVDESFETIGFTDENVDAYIENFFENTQKEKSLKEFLQNNINIKHIAYIPMMLKMICSLWKEEEFQNSVTMTELYSKVVENILKKHSALKNDERVYKRQNRKKIYEQLGTLAFKGLTQQKIVFDGDFIEKTLEEDIEFFEQSTINSGFLKSDNIDRDLLDNNFEFLHLTFQEYFSAIYVSRLTKKKQKKIIKKWKFYPHMQVFFAFLGGLIEDKEFLLSEIESEEFVQLELYIFMLIVTCLQNIKKDELKDERKDNILKYIFKIMKHKDFYRYSYILENITSIHHLIEIDKIEFSNQKEFSKKHRLKNILFLFSIGKYDDDKIEEFKEIINSLNTENISDYLLKRKSFENLINNGKYDKKVIDIFFDMKIYYEPIFGDKTRELFLKKYIGDYKEIISKKIKESNYPYFTLEFKREKPTKKKEQVKKDTTYKVEKEETFSVEEFYLLLKKREDTLPHQLKDYLGKYHYKLESLPNDTLLNMVDKIKEKEDISNLYIQEAILFLLTPISQTDKYSILLKLLSKELENYYYGLLPKIMKILKKSISLEEFMNKNNILDNNKIMFLNEFSVKELFENYKTEYDHYYFDIIYYKIIENRLPLYLKDNKWHTVVDGEEIETQEELNEEDIKEYGREPSNKKKKSKEIRANTKDEERFFNYDNLRDDLIEISLLETKNRNAISKESENETNDRFRNALLNRKYNVTDQSRAGESSSGINAGERDLVVCNSQGIDESVIEAFILKTLDSTVINKHYEKLVQRYDTVGNSVNFVLVYAKTENFDDLWEKYIEYAGFDNFVDTKDEHSQKDNVRVGISKYGKMKVYHLFIKFYSYGKDND